MQELEDEPDDVQNATPVADAIKYGQIDEFIKKQSCGKKFKPQKPRHCCPKKKLLEHPEKCIKKKIKKEMPPVAKPTCDDPYKRLKYDLVPRHCMTRDKHLDALAAPKYMHKSMTDEEKAMIKKVRTLYPRTEWLAKPTKRRILMTLIYKSMILPTNMLSHLIELLEGETAITPEQAESLIKDKELAKKKKCKRKEPKSKCDEELPNEVLGSGDPSLDVEVAYCQYSMAQRFVRSILNWKCTSPRDDYKDIAEVILDRLSQQLEYTPIGKEDRKSEQMRLISDIFAAWITEILIQVAEKYSTDMENETSDDVKLEDCCKSFDDDDDFTDEEDEYPKYLEAHCGLDHLEKCTQVGDDDDDDDEEEIVNDDEESTISEDSCVDEEQQTEPKPRMDCGTTTHSKDKVAKIDECCTANVKCSNEEELENICSRFDSAFKTDVPFITFAKIFDSLYCVIQSEPENDMCCPIDNRIHRAIYEKFEEALCRENPKLINNRMKDIINVITGKLARWLRKALNKRQIKFFDENPAQVESNEIRDWAQWIDSTVKFADCWSNWIHKVTMEAQCIKKSGGVTRGNWLEWTGKFESNALHYRKKYLEAVHQQHHNIMMLCDREVLKRCTKKDPHYSETTIRNTNFDSCAKMHD